MGLVLIKERRILFSEFALSKSQYLYNKPVYFLQILTSLTVLTAPGTYNSVLTLLYDTNITYNTNSTYYIYYLQC